VNAILQEMKEICSKGYPGIQKNHEYYRMTVDTRSQPITMKKALNKLHATVWLSQKYLNKRCCATFANFRFQCNRLHRFIQLVLFGRLRSYSRELNFTRKQVHWNHSQRVKRHTVKLTVLRATRREKKQSGAQNNSVQFCINIPKTVSERMLGRR